MRLPTLLMAKRRVSRNSRSLVGALAMALPTGQPPAVTPTDAAAMVRIVRHYRQVVLQDTTRIDFCAVAEFWDEKGAFVGTPEMVRYTNRADCSLDRLGPRRQVIVTGITRSATRDVVFSTTVRGGQRVFEQYEMVRGPNAGELQPTRYTIHSVVSP